MFKKLLILTLIALLCCSVATAADTTSMTDKARQAETQSLPSTIKHLDLILVLDKSGSMYGLESDTIGGYNAMIAKEKDLDVDTKVTTVLFNNKVDILTDRSNINSLSDMTTKDYRVGGSTALLDAVGNTIAKISDTPGIADKDHKVIFVIITDGQENASTEYSKATIQKMISDKKAQGWDFIFLGANIDAASEAQNLGIDADHAVKYRNTSTGVQKNFAAIAAYTRSAVQQQDDDSWKDNIEKDK